MAIDVETEHVEVEDKNVDAAKKSILQKPKMASVRIEEIHRVDAPVYLGRSEQAFLSLLRPPNIHG